MLYVFGDYIVDTRRRELRLAGTPVKMQRKVYQLLLYLIEHRDRLVTKEELLDRVWPEVHVEESAIARCISAIRKTVGDRRDRHHVIRTVHGQGYRFVAPVVQQSLTLLDAVPTFAAAPVPTSQFTIEPSIPLRSSEPIVTDLSPTPSIPPVHRAERKLVTVLYGAMRPALHEMDALTLDGQHAMVTALREMAGAAIEPYGGTLDHVSNDGFSVVFGAPQAHEDHAQRALLSALSVQRKWSSFTLGHLLPANTILTLGIGLHTGAVVVDDDAAGRARHLTVVGEVPSTAACLAQQATAGDILVSGTTAQLVSAAVPLEAQPPLVVAGQAVPLAIYRVQGNRASSTLSVPSWERHRSRFVGRQSELDALLTCWARVQRGQGQIIGVIGDAGMGKSRLLAEFRRTLKGQAMLYLSGRCESYGQTTPYLPLKALIEQACGLKEADHATAHAAKIRAGLQALNLVPDDWTPWLCHLLGETNLSDEMAALSPQTRRARTFDAIHQLLLASSRHQPLIIEVENAHWIDASSEAYLAVLVERLSGIPILLLTTYRPGYQPPWGATSNAMQLPLSPLRANDGERIVQGVLKRKQVPATLLRQLVARAQGNPLFLEELAQTVREEERELQSLPATIQTVLAARIDRLPPDAKRLLQAAAVIGAEVQAGLLQAVVSLPETTFQQQLRLLQAREMLNAVRLVPEAVYTFKHVLLREAAYQSLLEHTRRQYHQRIAQVLEADFSETTVTQPELLAHHYTEAGLPEQAVDYWQQAGKRAVERSANVEAIGHFSKALKTLTTLPDGPKQFRKELDIQITLGPALIAAKGNACPEVEYTYIRARKLCQQIGLTPQLLPVLRGLSRFYLLRAELLTARDLAEQCLRLAKNDLDPQRLMVSHSILGTILFYLGELALARTHHKQGIDLYDRQHFDAPQFHYGADPGVGCLSFAAFGLWIMGYPDIALMRLHEMLKLAQHRSHPLSLSSGWTYAAWLHQLRRESHITYEWAETAVAVSTKEQFPVWQGEGMVFRGWALAMQGQEAEGMTQLQQGCATYQAIGSELMLPYFLALQAQIYGRSGQHAEGLTLLAESLMFVDKNDEHWYEAELYRLKGDLLLAQSLNHHLEAETCFHQALSIARRQHAKSWELRAATSLAHLWQRQGKRQEAYDLLDPVYSWFTEGFDTLDLKEAKALLDTSPDAFQYRNHF